MQKKAIALCLLPMFTLVGCEGESTEQYTSVEAPLDNAAVSEDGFYTTKDLAALTDSYMQAKEKGYTGTAEEWFALMQLSQTDPVQAAKQAEESGFSGGEMLLGALAGAAVGALAANAMSSRSNMASNTYSAQRSNNNANYAYSQPDNRDRDRNGGGAGYVPASNNTASGTATRPLTSSTTSTTSTTPKSTTSTSSPKVTSVSRGGFGSSYGGGASSGG